MLWLPSFTAAIIFILLVPGYVPTCPSPRLGSIGQGSSTVTVSITFLNPLRKLSNNLAMKSIQIIDLQGRILHNLMVSGNSKTINLFNLKHIIYVAKVELISGQVITKKAIKRN